MILGLEPDKLETLIEQAIRKVGSGIYFEKNMVVSTIYTPEGRILKNCYTEGPVLDSIYIY